MDFLLAKFTPQELEAMVSSLKSPHQQFGDILLQRRVSVTIGDYASSAQFGWGGDRACARCTSNLDTDLDTGGSGTTYARRNLKLLRALPFFCSSYRFVKSTSKAGCPQLYSEYVFSCLCICIPSETVPQIGPRRYFPLEWPRQYRRWNSCYCISYTETPFTVSS
jgi:hypothetical protein